MKALTSIIFHLPLETLAWQAAINCNTTDHALTTTINNFYFNRLPRLRNVLPVINPALDMLVIKHKQILKLSQYLWTKSFSKIKAMAVKAFCMSCVINNWLLIRNAITDQIMPSGLSP